MALRGTLTHRKTRRLAVLLGIPQSYSLGVVEALWHVTAEQAGRGDIGKLKNIDIAAEMFHPEGEADKLVSALIDAGWVDEDREHRLIVHDWSSHADDATDMRLARSGATYADGKLPRMTKLSNDERATVCARFGWSCNGVARKGTTGHEKALPEPVPVPAPAPDPVPALNSPPIVPQGGPVRVPDPKPKKQKPAMTAEQREWFVPWWASYPRKVAKDAAESAWHEKVPDKATADAALAGLSAQLFELSSRERSLIPHPATWINGRRWTDEIPAIAVPGTYPVRDGPRYGNDRKARASAEFDARMLEEAKRIGMLNA